MSAKFNQLAETDEEQVRKTAPMPVQKATVVRSPTHPDEDGYHQVYVELYYDGTQTRAAVLTPIQGDANVPEEGEDVMVLFGAADKPVVLGSFYPVDDEFGNELSDTVPTYEEGDRVIGNGTGSRVSVLSNGTIQIITDENKPVDIDVQSASVGLNTDQTIPTGDTWETIVWDDVEEDQDDLFQETNNTILARYGGLYTVHASVEFPTPGQNNSYDIGIFVNDTMVKRVSRQSAVNEPLSLTVYTDKLLDSGDVIDVRVRHTSGESRTVAGDPVTAEFTVNRSGRRRGGDRPRQ